MLKFGPSGFSDDFALTHKSTREIPDWLICHRLDCYEYSFTNGVRLSDETAAEYGGLFAQKNIEISVHAPYFINFANPDPVMVEKSIDYVIQSLKKMKLLGAKKLVFHPGSLLNRSREEAFSITKQNILKLLDRLDKTEGLGEYYLCPETMGKHGQVGSVEEIAQICALHTSIIPTLDFGHINAFNGGSLVTEDDFEKVFLVLKKYLGERYNKVHIHFSKIEYGEKGEIRHLTNRDKVFGPEFEPLARVLSRHGVSGCVISESSGTQTSDAAELKNIFDMVNNR